MANAGIPVVNSMKWWSLQPFLDLFYNKPFFIWEISILYCFKRILKFSVLKLLILFGNKKFFFVFFCRKIEFYQQGKDDFYISHMLYTEFLIKTYV